MEEIILVFEGQDHRSLCRLVNPVFSRKAVKGSIDKFESPANDLIDRFIDCVHCICFLRVRHQSSRLSLNKILISYYRANVILA